MGKKTQATGFPRLTLSFLLAVALIVCSFHVPNAKASPTDDEAIANQEEPTEAVDTEDTTQTNPLESDIPALYSIKAEPVASQFSYTTETVYNGKKQEVSVSPDLGAGKVIAVYYDKSKTAPVDAGVYEITIDVEDSLLHTAKDGLYLGKFRIYRADLSKIKMSIAKKTWTGKRIRPKAFTYNGFDFPFVNNAKIEKYGSNKNIGKGFVKLVGRGNFTGTKTVRFNIVPKKISITKTTAVVNSVKVSWKKSSKSQKVTKYQIRYRQVKAEVWKTKSFAASKSSGVIKGLKKGKKYEFQIRAYKTVKGVKYYGAWSTVKTKRTFLPVRLNVPLINQFTTVYAPTGCEIASLTMLLMYAGYYKPKKHESNKAYKRRVFNKSLNTMWYSGNPNRGFVGNPRGWSGWTIYPGCAGKWIKKRVGSYKVLTAASHEKLRKVLRDGKPIVVWMIHPRIGMHCLCITGFNEKGFYINDPYGTKNWLCKYKDFDRYWARYSRMALTY